LGCDRPLAVTDKYLLVITKVDSSKGDSG